MPDNGPAPSVGFSRYLGLPAVIALGAAVSLPLALFVLGGEVLRFAGEDAPQVYLLAAFLFLPAVLSLAERAGEIPGSGHPYQLARAGGSTRQAFAAGWLSLGGFVCVAALLLDVLAVGAQRFLEWIFGLEGLHPDGLLGLVVILACVHVLLAVPGRWRGRTALVWGAILALSAMIGWGFLHQPASSGELPVGERPDHDLAAVALLAAVLWGLDPVLASRARMRRPERRLAPALLIVSGLALLLGALGMWLAVRFPDLLRDNWAPQLVWSQNRLELASLMVGLALCGAGLYQVLTGALRLSGAMARDGLLPRWWCGVAAEEEVSFRPLGLVAAASALLAATAPTLMIAGGASLTFLWTAVVVLLPHARRPRKSLAAGRAIALPLHPLLPGLAVAGGVFFSLILPRLDVAIGLAWAIVGGLFYAAYARRGGLETARRELLVDAAAAGSEAAYRVLVGAAGERDLSSIRVGAALARARGGELQVLRVVPLIEQLPVGEMRDAAAAQWRRLDELVESAGPLGVPVRPLVRIAPTPAAGILATAAQNRADFLVFGWSKGKGADADDEPAVERIFAATSRPLAVVRGSFTGAPRRVLVTTAGGPHAPVAVELAGALAAATDGEVTLASVAVRGRTAAAEEALRQTRDKAPAAVAVEKVIEAKSVAAGIAAEAEGHDVLLLGAAVDPLVRQTVPRGLPTEIAEARAAPTILVKRAERAQRFWLRRLWELAENPLPTATVRERAEVFADMRRSARADVDFLVLITLATAIAAFGLRQNSAAVIIGAMLVAPLMSPILAVAHGIVQGNLYMIRRGSVSTAQGIAVAIGVSTALTLLLAPILPTPEIQARGQPGLLDLLVALVSGAAAAYAVSRKSVAAALPGVAISAALVPPLCVVGYGLGSSHFRIAGGALLLFLTNLAGIVLVGALVFLLLGFRPSRAARRRQVLQAVRLAVVSLLVLVIPLAFLTRDAVQKGKIELEIARVVRHRIVDPQAVRLLDLAVERGAGTYIVSMTVLAYRELPADRVEKLRKHLGDTVGVPVEIRATVVDAGLVEARAPAGEE